MYQTHSNKVILINNKNKYMNKFKSDAIVTKIKGIALELSLLIKSNCSF